MFYWKWQIGHKQIKHLDKILTRCPSHKKTNEMIVTSDQSEACIKVTWSSLTNQRPLLLLKANHSGVFQATSWCSSAPPAPRSPSSSSYTGGQRPAPRYQDVYRVSSNYGPKVSVTETYFAYWVKKAQKVSIVLIEDSPDQMWLRPTVAHWKRHPQLSCIPGDGKMLNVKPKKRFLKGDFCILL